MQYPSPLSPAPERPRQPDPSALRRRADELRHLAGSIERSLVMALADAGDADTWNTNRTRLCDRMLARSLHQLHEAADDLREAALGFCDRADELDRAHRPCVA